MRLIYGTHNRAKLDAMRRYVEPIGLDIIEPPGVEDVIPLVDESGSDPLENAELKARAFFSVFRQPVFACDSGLFFDEAVPEDQPGTHVRRARGRDLTDDQMIMHYAALAKRYGGRLTARYQNAICLIVDETRIYRSMDEALSGERFWLVDTPHSRRNPGFPLDTLSVDMNTGQYFFDLPGAGVQATAIGAGFCAFFEQALCFTK